MTVFRNHVFLPYVRGAMRSAADQAVLMGWILQTTTLAWLLLVIVWLVSALRTKRAIQRQSGASRLVNSAILIVGVYLIFFAKSSGIPWLDLQLYTVTIPIALAGLLAVVTGVAFSIWARFMLGGNWSSSVTVKENHTLVRSGPYRIVRHPIYTGILLGMLGSAIQRGGMSCFVGVLFCVLSFWLKSRIEERFMVQSFGEQYLQYRHEAKALVPFIL